MGGYEEADAILERKRTGRGFKAGGLVFPLFFPLRFFLSEREAPLSEHTLPAVVYLSGAVSRRYLKHKIRSRGTTSFSELAPLLLHFILSL